MSRNTCAGAIATLVVAVDYQFWFGYGTRGKNGNRVRGAADRVAFLDVGLELLDRIDAPIVLGDFPDMSDAVGRGMLSAPQQPNTVGLEQLNARLYEWASSRERVTVVPLAAIVEKMRTGDAFTVGRHRWPANAIERVLQDDRLHPTTEGLGALGHAIGLAMLEAGLVGVDELDPDLVRLMDELGEEFEDAAPAPVEDQ